MAYIKKLHPHPATDSRDRRWRSEILIEGRVSSELQPCDNGGWHRHSTSNGTSTGLHRNETDQPDHRSQDRKVNRKTRHQYMHTYLRTIYTCRNKGVELNKRRGKFDPSSQPAVQPALHRSIWTGQHIVSESPADQTATRGSN